MMASARTGLEVRLRRKYCDPLIWRMLAQALANAGMTKVATAGVRHVMTRPKVTGFLRKHAIKLIASALITGGVLYTVHKGGLKLVPDGGDFGSVHWWYLALYVPLLLAMTWFRSVRWRFLLRGITEVPKLRLFAVSCAGFAAILLLPFRLGELARPYMLRTRPGEEQPGEKPLTMTAAT